MSRRAKSPSNEYTRVPHVQYDQVGRAMTWTEWRLAATGFSKQSTPKPRGVLVGRNGVITRVQRQSSPFAGRPRPTSRVKPIL